MRIALAVAALIATPAQAATLVSTFDVTGCGGACLENMHSYPGFDAALGTLNSILVEASAEVSRYYSAASWSAPSTFDLTFDHPFTVSLGGPVPGFGTTAFSFNVAGSDHFILQGQQYRTLIATGSGSYQVPAEQFGDFTRASMAVIGEGPYSLASQISGPGTIGANAGDPVSFLTHMRITYDYTPAVPEPATWAMLLAGFGLVGWSLRQNRRIQRAAIPGEDRGQQRLGVAGPRGERHRLAHRPDAAITERGCQRTVGIGVRE